jgi:hypothetical protein
MLTIRGEDIVVRSERVEGTDGDRFLPDVQVTEAADEALGIGLARALFEPPREEHVAQHAVVLFDPLGIETG